MAENKGHTEKTKVVVETTSARNISGKNAQGRPYDFNVQNVLVFRPGESWPDKAEITLPDARNGRPFEVGEYLLEFEPYVDRRKRIAVGYKLVPMF